MVVHRCAWRSNVVAVVVIVGTVRGRLPADGHGCPAVRGQAERCPREESADEGTCALPSGYVELSPGRWRGTVVDVPRESGRRPCRRPPEPLTVTVPGRHGDRAWAWSPPPASGHRQLGVRTVRRAHDARGRAGHTRHDPDHPGAACRTVPHAPLSPPRPHAGPGPTHLGAVTCWNPSRRGYPQPPGHGAGSRSHRPGRSAVRPASPADPALSTGPAGGAGQGRHGAPAGPSVRPSTGRSGDDG